MKKIKNADGTVTDPAPQTFFQKHQKAIMIGGLIVIAGLVLLPDVLIRKYVPWVK
jgi:hypothetical protein